MGNGAKAAQKRQRKNHNESGGSRSQLKTNKAAMSISCQFCKQSFFITTRTDALEEHSEHHPVPFAECFPDHKK